MRHPITVIALLLVLVSACDPYPGEDEALARLAEAEVLGTGLIESAVGIEPMASWVRVDAPRGEACSLTCSDCASAGIVMKLSGQFDQQSVMDDFADAARRAGGSAEEVGLFGLSYLRDITIGGDTGQHLFTILWEAGSVEIRTNVRCYHVDGG